MKNAPASAGTTSRLALALLFSTALAACGGGGTDPTSPATPSPAPAPSPAPSPSPSPSPSPAPAPASNTRLAGNSYDFDANGTEDAHDQFSYDDQGRVLSRRYVYTGDGTPDLDRPYGAQGETEENTYDAQGRLLTSTTTRADRTSSRFALSYAADGTLARMDSSARAADGSVISAQYTLYSYSGGRMSGSVIYQDGLAVMRETVGYDTNGRPGTLDRVNPVLPSAFNSRTVYEWNADGTLATQRLDINRDGIDEEAWLYTYDAGRLVRSVKAVGGRYAGQPGVTYHFTYDGARLQRVETDLRSNGSIDARFTVALESGTCRPMVLPMMIPLVTATGYRASATGEASYCAN